MIEPFEVPDDLVPLKQWAERLLVKPERLRTLSERGDFPDVYHIDRGRDLVSGILLAVAFGLGWLGGDGWNAYEERDLRGEILVLERVLAEEQWWHDRRRRELEQLQHRATNDTTVRATQRKELNP